jgi:hypothetical protein
MNKRISHFDFTTLPFALCITGIPQFKNQNAAGFLNPAFWEKGGPSLMKKRPFSWTWGFL